MIEAVIDIETYSSVNLPKCGTKKYAKSKDFKILLLGWKEGDAPREVYDLYHNGLPDHIRRKIYDPEYLKIAHNAFFERTCLEAELGEYCDPAQWLCTMALGATLGLPLSLDEMTRALKMDILKYKKEGDALIQMFCVYKKRKAGIFRVLPQMAPQDWIRFIDYCGQDVDVEHALLKRLNAFRLSPTETDIWILDQKINDKGVRIDLELVNKAIEINSQYREETIDYYRELTGMKNPNSVKEIKDIIRETTGDEIKSINKSNIKELIDLYGGVIATGLEARAELRKASVAKYNKMLKSEVDGRLYGLLQYSGAVRTKRWAGRGTQIHNLPQNHLDNLDDLRDIVKYEDLESLRAVNPSITRVLSELLRPAFIPDPGCLFGVADFSAIEARVLAWLANEKWRIEVFENKGDIYEASAAAMFNADISLCGRGTDYRAKGKIAELACGYGGHVGAFLAFGADKMGLEYDECEMIVENWRLKNPNIVKFWYKLNDAVTAVIRDNRRVQLRVGTGQDRLLKIWREDIFMFIELPSGSRIAYPYPHMKLNKYGRMSPAYWGINDRNNKKVWGPIDTYGGKLTENVTQALARDLLAFMLLVLEENGFDIAFHVHDEAIANVKGLKDLRRMEYIMSQPVPFCPGLPLNAEGFISEFYKKDG